MNSTNSTIRRRHRARGNALIEFALTLPIIFFLIGLVMYMGLAMLTKQQSLVAARHNLWHAAAWYWPPMKLEGYTPPANPSAPADAGDMPRGEGEDLARLLDDLQKPPGPPSSWSSNGAACNYWSRIWGNLPGRHHTEASRSFDPTAGPIYNWINRTATSEHFRDSSPWHFYHLDAWRIARSGPLNEVAAAFINTLQAHPAAVEPPKGQPYPLDFYSGVRDQIIKRWWHGSDVLDDEGYGGAAPPTQPPAAG